MTTPDKKISPDDIFDAFLLLTQYCGVSTALEELENSEEVSRSSSLAAQIPYKNAYSETILLRDSLKLKFCSLIPSAYSDKTGLSPDAIRVALVGFEILKCNFDDCLNMLRDLVSLVQSELPTAAIVMKVASITRDLAKDGLIVVTSEQSSEEVREMLQSSPDPSIRKKFSIGLDITEKGREILEADFEQINKRLQSRSKTEEDFSDLLSMAPASTSVN